MFKRKSAQSILEYIIVLSAIIVAAIVATAPGGLVQNAVNRMFSDSSQAIEQQSANFLNRIGRGDTVAPGDGG